jgi:starvation-inducible DNA-binding protein
MELRSLYSLDSLSSRNKLPLGLVELKIPNCIVGARENKNLSPCCERFIVYRNRRLLVEMYEEVNELYDAFAERLITIGGTPVSSLQAYLTITNIKEATTFISIQDTLITIKKDYEYLINAMKNVLTIAHAENDEATADACIGAIGKFEKTIWVVQASLS